MPSKSPALPSPTSPTSPASSSGLPARRRPRVTAEHTLNRVRENQRRHRARRKDYIESLEQKLAETEQQLAEARAEIGTLKAEREACAASKPSEGTNMPEKLEKRGDTTIDAEQAWNRQLDLELSSLISSIPSTPPATFPNLQDLSFLGEFYITDTLPTPIPTPTLPLGLHTAVDGPSPTDPIPSPSPLDPSLDASSLDVPLPTGPPPCCDPPPTLPAPDPTDPECSSCKTRPPPAPSESTTLCAQAYVMIQEHNFRGIDAGTIRLWLVQGFRRAQRQGEGCRVENGALFRLLDFISGM